MIEVDNFKIFENILFFNNPDMYILMYVQTRGVDVGERDGARDEMDLGYNKNIRKFWVLRSIDDMRGAIDEVKELCSDHRARTYIIPTGKSLEFLKNGLGIETDEELETHIEIQDPYLFQYAVNSLGIYNVRISADVDTKSEHIIQSVIKDAIELSTQGDISQDIYVIPSKKGVHIVSPQYVMREMRRRHPFMFISTNMGDPAYFCLDD